MMGHLNSLPSVEKILQTEAALVLASTFGRPLTLRAVREALATERDKLRLHADRGAPLIGEILGKTENLLQKWTQPEMRRVINATGVILHTNLGRAPLSAAAIQAMRDAALGYTNLEFDLATGKRGQRSPDAASLVCRLTGAPAALVVNNNAAAVLLVLAALAAGKGVAIARSQLVEIGGGFRMPEVMKQSRARLVEVGTTNKVRLSDFETVLEEVTAFLTVHRSNFQIVGFAEEPDLKQLARIAHGADKLLIDDLGSGALLDTAPYGLAHEPTIQESLAAGADVVCLSGDKLLGGPQAGIIVGSLEALKKISRHPLARAVRADKVTLAGLSATLLHFLRDEAEERVPVWRMMSMTAETARKRAQDWARALGRGDVTPSQSTLGGGSLPGESLATYVLSISVSHPDRALAALRRCDPPVIARLERERLLLDPRTVQEDETAPLLAGLTKVLMETA